MTSSHVLAAAPAAHAAGPQYSILVAATPDEVRSAQRLRYSVFADELGARLHTDVPGLDIDEFDPHCDHLLVREDRTDEIVGTYRMLPPNRAVAAGRFYSETEFDLSGLAALRELIVETGRSCVHPDHRTGAVINLMWTGIARYLHLHGHRWLAGCASVPLVDGGAMADSVWEVVRERHMSPPPLRVTPHHPYAYGPPPTTQRAELVANVPPLLRGYLRLGAWICGETALDVDFGVADFFVLLSLDKVDPRYLRHFLGDSA
jgi:putative hemolysin